MEFEGYVVKFFSVACFKLTITILDNVTSEFNLNILLSWSRV